MAIIHDATLRPSKLEMIAGWLPTQPWFVGEQVAAFAQVGAFRFDDPAGEVGVQVILVRQGDGLIHQVPLTYRSAPLADSEGFIAEMEHSVLGPRYVYDGCHDPIFLGQLVDTVLTGGREVDEIVEVDGKTITLPKSMHVRGSGAVSAAVPALPTVPVEQVGSVAVMRSGAVEITVARVLDGGIDANGAATLIGDWGDGESGCLATVRSLDNA
jgi:hypothetical protein